MIVVIFCTAPRPNTSPASFSVFPEGATNGRAGPLIKERISPKAISQGVVTTFILGDVHGISGSEFLIDSHFSGSKVFS